MQKSAPELIKQVRDFFKHFIHPEFVLLQFGFLKLSLSLPQFKQRRTAGFSQATAFINLSNRSEVCVNHRQISGIARFAVKFSSRPQL